MTVRASTRIAGVLGRPVAHSLSPVLHNAWLKAAEIDGVYIALSPTAAHFRSLVEGMRGGTVAGFNITVPFKADALALADIADAAASGAGAANVLFFHADGSIEARNTDGIGLLAAFTEQAPMFHVEHRPVVILGAGGGARGAAAAVRSLGDRQIRIVNRTLNKAEALAEAFGGRAYGLEAAALAFAGAGSIINATSVGLGETAALLWPLHAAPDDAVVMDMVYRPLETPLLSAAKARGLRTVDGLAMLIGQARPSFEAFFGVPPPDTVDARQLLLDALDSKA
jgi:shikimate dehydrogenase